MSAEMSSGLWWSDRSIDGRRVSLRRWPPTTTSPSPPTPVVWRCCRSPAVITSSTPFVSLSPSVRCLLYNMSSLFSPCVPIHPPLHRHRPVLQRHHPCLRLLALLSPAAARPPATGPARPDMLLAERHRPAHLFRASRALVAAHHHRHIPPSSAASSAASSWSWVRTAWSHARLFLSLTRQPLCTQGAGRLYPSFP